MHLRSAILALMLTIVAGLAACSPRSTDVPEPGSYPAANSSDCLPAITLVDQHGRDVTLASLKGRPMLIDFIYTTCAGPCPLMTARMAAVAKLLGAKLLVVRAQDPHGKDEAGYVVAVDTVDAGIRDRVLIVSGSSARMASGLKDCPVDAAIVGVVDTVEVGE